MSKESKQLYSTACVDQNSNLAVCNGVNRGQQRVGPFSMLFNPSQIISWSDKCLVQHDSRLNLRNFGTCRQNYRHGICSECFPLSFKKQPPLRIFPSCSVLTNGFSIRKL